MELDLINIVLFCKHFQELIAENVWNIDLQVNQQKVTGVYGKRSIGETDLYVTCLDVYGKRSIGETDLYVTCLDV